MGDNWVTKKLERIEMLERRINSLKGSISDYSPKEWHYRTGLESLDSLQKTLVLNEIMLVLVKNDLPITFLQNYTEPLGANFKYYNDVVATA